MKAKMNRARQFKSIKERNAALKGESTKIESRIQKLDAEAAKSANEVNSKPSQLPYFSDYKSHAEIFYFIFGKMCDLYPEKYGKWLKNKFHVMLVANFPVSALCAAAPLGNTFSWMIWLVEVRAANRTTNFWQNKMIWKERKTT